MITVRIDGITHTLDSVNDELALLTGDESLLLEEYLGGFDQLGQRSTKSIVVMVWLTMRSVGQPMTFEEIQAIPGLTFGNVVQTDNTGEPEDPMKDPGRPLAGTNASNGSHDGNGGSVASLATSDSSGVPA